MHDDVNENTFPTSCNQFKKEMPLVAAQSKTTTRLLMSQLYSTTEDNGTIQHIRSCQYPR